MKKKILGILLILVALVSLTGCSNKAALQFKEDYESLNGKTNKNGSVHRTVTIAEDNPYKEVTAKDILKKIDHKDTFYVYFGDKLCPWCRSVIEKSIEVAKDSKVKKIYYVAIWDDEGNEILRDRYAFQDGEVVKTIDGTEEYYKLLVAFKDLLSDYYVTKEDGEQVSVGEKRIYAPNYIYVEKGVPKKITEGISSLQEDSRGELTEEILKEEEKMFTNFFNNKK